MHLIFLEQKHQNDLDSCEYVSRKMNPNDLMSNILIISITFPVNNHIVHCSFIYLKNKANVDINT